MGAAASRPGLNPSLGLFSVSVIILNSLPPQHQCQPLQDMTHLPPQALFQQPRLTITLKQAMIIISLCVSVLGYDQQHHCGFMVLAHWIHPPAWYFGGLPPAPCLPVTHRK